MTVTEAHLTESGGLRGIEGGSNRVREDYGAPPPAFAPDDIATLALWYDPSVAATRTMSGSNITAMTSIGGSYGPTLTPMATAPVLGSQNGLATAVFVQTPNSRLRGTLGAALTPTSWTFFQVYRLDNTVANARAWSMQNASSTADHDNVESIAMVCKVGNTPATYRAGLNVIPAATYTTTWRVLCITNNAGAVTTYVDGTSVATGTLSSSALNVTRLGYGGQAGSAVSDEWQGGLAETGFYNALLTTTELNNLTNYLMLKWLPAPTAPDAPTSLNASPGNLQATLSWTAPAFNGGLIITDYTVQYRTTAGPGTWTTFTDAVSTTTSATVTGLTNGTSYDFRVAAVNSIGASAYSTTATATPFAPTGGAVSVIQAKGYCSNGGTITPISLPAALTNGSRIHLFVSVYQQTPGTPVTSAGTWSWTTEATASDTDWRVRAFVSSNTSTGSPTFKPNIPDGSNYWHFCVVETMNDSFLDSEMALQFTASDALPTLTTVVDGAVIYHISTAAPTTTIRTGPPTDRVHHDFNVADGQGPGDSSIGGWTIGWDLTTSTAGVAPDATLVDWFSPYYNGIAISLAPT